MRGLVGKLVAHRWSWLPVAISLTLLALLAWKAEVRLEGMGERLCRANWAILSVTLILSAAWHLGIGAHKWWRILRAQGAPVSYWEVLGVRVGADPIRFVAPMQVGALISSVYFGKLQTLGFSRAAGSVLFDKALNLFGAVVWLYVGFAAIAQVPITWQLAIHTMVVGMVLTLAGSGLARRTILRIAEKLHSKVGRLTGGILSVFEKLSPTEKIGFLLYGVLFQLRPLAVCALLLMAFQPDTTRLPSPRQFVACGSVVAVMSNVPSMGGIGPREAALMEAFKNVADPQTLLTVGLTMSFVLQIFPAILGIPLMFRLLKAVAPGGKAAAGAPPLRLDGSGERESP